MASPALTARRLTRRFGDRIAVEDLSFDLAPGEIFALLGPNGAGKTTTLRMLAGLIRPTSGSVAVDGEAMSPGSASRLRRRIGFLTEAPGLWESLTVRQNLTVYAQLYGLANAGSAVADALAMFQIADRSEERPARLSKGLKQRVALARTLIHQPGIVLLDEPTAGLDPESARTVRRLIVNMRREGRAVVLCTHNLDEVERVADRVAVLRSRLVAIGTPEALQNELFAPRVRIRLSGPVEPFAEQLRASGMADVRTGDDWLSVPAGSMTTPRIVRTLVDLGADIEEVEHEERSLEEVYIALLNRSGAPR